MFEQLIAMLKLGILSSTIPLLLFRTSHIAAKFS